MKKFIEFIKSLFRKPPPPPAVIVEPVKVPMPLMPKLDRLDIALSITGKFEGRGYSQVTGNFDGMGISCGILQWNLGMESLQAKILRPYISKHGSIDALHIFPSAIIDGLSNLRAIAAVNRCKEYMFYDGDIKPNWRAAWESFLLLPAVIELQKLACSGIATQADTMMQGLGFDSLRAFCWCFDIVTHNGSLKGVKRPKPDRARASELINEMKPSKLGGGDMLKNRNL